MHKSTFAFHYITKVKKSKLIFMHIYIDLISDKVCLK